MIRFCNKDDISQKDYELALTRGSLLLEEQVWKKGRDYFRSLMCDDKSLFFIPIRNKAGEIICFAYQDNEANRELRFLKEIQETEGALQFTDLFPDIISVTIVGCNELAYYFMQYLNHIGVTVYVAGKYWNDLGYQQNYQEADAHNLMIYAEGSNQDYLNGYSVNKILCSMSAEFECIDQIYEENFRQGIIKDTSFSFEGLMERLSEVGETNIFIIGTGERSQDAYDLLLEEGGDVRGFLQNGLTHERTLFGKPVLSRNEVFMNVSRPVLIQCTDFNSALGTEDTDNYSYYGCERNKSFFLLNDYVDVPESKLIHILKDKKIVLAGDERLCVILRKFYSKVLKDRIAIRYTDNITAEAIDDKIVVLTLYRPYGVEVTLNGQLIEKQDAIKDYIEKNGIDYTDYFSMIEHFVGMEYEERKYRLNNIRPKGILLGNNPWFSGNILFRDLLDGHAQILKMNFVILNDNLFSYCIRLSCEKSENIVDSFWQIFNLEANLDCLDWNFPDREKFNIKLRSLLTLSDKFSSQELFIIFTLAYEAMFDSSRLDDISDKVIYWEPHNVDRDNFCYYAKWLEDESILGNTIKIFRNSIVQMGSCMNYLISTNSDFNLLRRCLEQLAINKSYESADWKEFIIRFEDLKIAPTKTTSDICEKIGIKWNKSLLQTTRGGKKSYYFDASTTGFELRPVYDSYEDYLSSFDRFRISVINAYAQKKYGYVYLNSTIFSRKELQEMFLKDFRFHEQIKFNECEKEFFCKQSVFHLLCIRLWEERKKLLLEHINKTEIICEYKDVCKVHKIWTIEKEKTLSERKIALSEIREFISEHEQIVLYGTGNDAKQILNNLHVDEKSEFVFCDKKALENKIEFEGRTVLDPNCLVNEFKNAGIIITSSQFGKEIFQELVNRGIDAGQIYCNNARW